MTKLFYAEQLQDLLYPKATSDAKMDEDVALAVISQARDEVIRLEVLKNKQETNIIPDSWLNEFTGDDAIEIKKDKYGKYYTDLPVGVIAMIDNLGVYNVWIQGKDDLLIPVPSSFKMMYKRQSALGLEGELGYYLSGKKRLIFIQDMPLDCKIECRLLAQSSDLDEYDEFPCDDAMIPTILSRAVQLYQIHKGIPEDKINNNISE